MTYSVLKSEYDNPICDRFTQPPNGIVDFTLEMIRRNEKVKFTSISSSGVCYIEAV